MSETGTALATLDDLTKMAQVLGKGRMFGKTAEEMLPLMLIAQSEGRNPVTVAQEYDVIQGRPAMNARTAQTRFQASGGTIEWLERTDRIASARLTHPQGGSLVITWDWARATNAGLTGKDNYKKFAAQMLSSRVIGEGVRAVFPGCLNGFYTTEEVDDFEPKVRKAEPTAPPVSESGQPAAAPATAAAPPAGSAGPAVPPAPPYWKDAAMEVKKLLDSKLEDAPVFHEVEIKSIRARLLSKDLMASADLCEAFVEEVKQMLRDKLPGDSGTFAAAMGGAEVETVPEPAATVEDVPKSDTGPKVGEEGQQGLGIF